MKDCFIAVCSVCIFSYSYAGNHYGRQYGQDNSPRLSFSFNAGVGIPMGGFAKKDSLPPFDSLTLFGHAKPPYDSTHAYGFAKPGFHFEVEISYRFAKNIGIAAVTGGTISPFDANAYQSAYHIPATYSVTAQGAHYEAEYFLGPFLYLPVSDNFSIEAKALFGLLSSKYPDVDVASTMPNNYSEQLYKFSIGKNFGYYFSVGGKVMLDNMVGIVATVSYTGASVTYPGLVYSNTTAGNYSYSNFSFSNRSMSLGILSLTAGFSISF